MTSSCMTARASLSASIMLVTDIFSCDRKQMPIELSMEIFPDFSMTFWVSLFISRA
jgi:hypothetical protein